MICTHILLIMFLNKPKLIFLHYCSSRRMALALNNLKRVDMPLNKETNHSFAYS